MDTGPVRRPFLASDSVLKHNRMSHGWSTALTLLPEGTGMCLDLGAGDGRDRGAIERPGWRWIGVDVLPHSALCLAGDARRLPFADGEFDIVLANQTLEHFASPWSAVAEMFRVLKRGGRFIGSTSFLEPSHDSYFGFSHWAIEELLNGQGFDILEIRPGTSAFVTIAWAMLPDMRVGEWLGVWSGRVAMGLVRACGAAYMSVRFGRKSPEWRQFQTFWKKAPLRFAGHIVFTARKPAVSQGGAERNTAHVARLATNSHRV